MEPDLAPATREALQQHFRSFRERTTRDGGRIGFKIAFNPPALQQKLGLPFSLVVGLPKAGLHPGGSHSLVGTTRPALEPEVAVQLGRGLSDGASETEAAEAIAALMPAIELVDFDRPVSGPDQLPAIIEAGVFHRCVVFGQPGAAPPNGRVTGMQAKIEHRGTTLAEVDAETATGQVPQLLLHIARLLARFEMRLEAGDRLILGSMVAPAPAAPGDHFGLTLAGIGSASLDLVE